MTFLEHSEKVCAPWARLGVRAIRWAIRQLRFEGATIAGLARQLATSWNTVWSHIKPHLMTPPVSQGFVYPGSMRGVWHHQDRRRGDLRAHRHRGPDSREGTFHGPVVGPGAVKVWHRVQERGRARKRLPCGGANRDARSPSRDCKNAIAWPAPRMQPACAAPVTSSHTPGMPQVRDAVASSKRRPVTAGARGDPLYQIRLLLRVSRDRLMKRQQERLREAFTADEARH